MKTAGNWVCKPEIPETHPKPLLYISGNKMEEIHFFTTPHTTKKKEKKIKPNTEGKWVQGTNLKFIALDTKLNQTCRSHCFLHN